MGWEFRLTSLPTEKMHKTAETAALPAQALYSSMALALGLALALCGVPPAQAQTKPQSQAQAQPKAQAKPRPKSRAQAQAEDKARQEALFAMVPTPLLAGPPAQSEAEAEREYRKDAARHLYAAYPMRIYRGQLPPLLYSVMVVETELDPDGQILNVSVVRKPAVDEVAPWVVAMIRRSGPFPPPVKLAGGVRYTDVWLVDKSGNFQLDTLTEGQR